MPELLYINASPRGEESAAVQAAQIFKSALPQDVNVTTLDLFAEDLPDVTPEMISAKFKFAMGAELSSEENTEWAPVITMVDQFKSADAFLLAVPMWNFSVPYRMKQYIDLITHPGLTFAPGENGMQGLASGSATVIYSRGGDYSPKDGHPDPFDFQSPYLSAWLGLVGAGPVTDVLVQKTLAGPDAQTTAVEGAREQLEALARAVGG